MHLLHILTLHGILYFMIVVHFVSTDNLFLNLQLFFLFLLAVLKIVHQPLDHVDQDHEEIEVD